MKNTKKKNKKPIPIKELAEHLETEVNKQLNVVILPNGAVAYKDYVIKLTAQGNWGVYNYKNSDFIEQFYLKSCALMAAREYNRADLQRFNEIKIIDRKYWSHHSDEQRCKKYMPATKDFERYQILLNKLEYSKDKAEHYRDQISRMFKWSFV